MAFCLHGANSVFDRKKERAASFSIVIYILLKLHVKQQYDHVIESGGELCCVYLLNLQIISINLSSRLRHHDFTLHLVVQVWATTCNDSSLQF